VKKAISLIVSTIIIAVIYSTIDLSALLAAFRRTDLILFLAAVAMVIPITAMTAWRLKWLVPNEAALTFGHAVRLILGASVLNMVLPAKMGDLAKFAFMRRQGVLSGSLAFSIVIFEKATDMLALLAWCLFGLFLFSGSTELTIVLALAIGAGILFGITLLASRTAANLFFRVTLRIAPISVRSKLSELADAWTTMHGYFWRNRGFALSVLGYSLFLWFLHLFQIWLFIQALGAPVPFISNLALTPLAILAGLLPLTFAGIGTRDAALIFLFSPFMDAGTGAALGLLCTLRYILPALGGLPFVTNLAASVRNGGNTESFSHSDK
jgi:glycosyltransferase 2 family protein